MTRKALEQLRPRVGGAPPASAETARPLVLVVEDNPAMTRFVRESLEVEYRTEAARDGEEGLAKALALEPDLIISDAMMPGMSGAALVSEVRRIEKLNGVPIMLLTAKADAHLPAQLLREGAQDYLPKPFVAEELKARVGNLVTMKRAREVLQRELETQVRDVHLLAGEVANRKRDLESAFDAMRLAREQADRASQAKSEFLRLVSHELRTPLAAFQLNLESLRRDRATRLTPRQTQTIERMQRSSGRLLGLIESLLEYARVESGGLHVEYRPVDVKALIGELADEFHLQAEAKGLTLRAAVAPGAGIESDPRLLRLILTNLVGNAVKYTREGRVEIRAECGDGRCLLSVTDSGPGIPEAEHRRIFEPFAQLESVDHKHTPGVGLGLALVREMVLALGGRIDLRSRVGEGSTFTVDLPAAFGKGDRSAEGPGSAHRTVRSVD